MDNIFVTTDWLAQHLSDPNVVILDGSWFLPIANRKPYEEYLVGHIPGAVFFDIDGVADHSTGLPHMLLGADFLRAHRVLVARSQGRLYFTYSGGTVFPVGEEKTCQDLR